MKTTTVKTLLIMLLIGTNITLYSQKKTEFKTTVFNVDIHCESCKAKFEKNIAFEKGVKDIQVNLDNKTICITYNPTKTSDNKLITAFKKLGYTATIKSNGCCTNGTKKDCKKECGDSKDCKKECEKKCLK